MTTIETEEKYVCCECLEVFPASDLIDGYSFPEYPGASIFPEKRSPCCAADYDYIE